jgi:NAD(P)-dependent dehydrogenase (short-subunit alcohol dehydrogenase family)
LAIGSVQESKPHPQMPVYAASKAALTNLMRNFALQFASAGVTCNTLSPGVICTDRNEEALSDGNYAEKVRQAIPAGFFGDPEDCAGAALLLCSDASRYITGQTLFVDGGLGL